MNLKTIIPIIVLIVIAGIIIAGIIEWNTYEIQWRESGPFQIEKYEYYLGEKIFLYVNNIPLDVSGKVIFFRPMSDEMNKYPKELEGVPAELIAKKIQYMEIKFDGENKQNFNKFFEPRMNEWKSICSTNDLVGEWVIVFSGTQYEPMNFTILNQTMPGDTRSYEPLVGVGGC
jgi:hypothetical protein|tara:strand:- start:41 stop:559 length:519 start_codon:yes stop_codon:yes gene_type:complete